MSGGVSNNATPSAPVASEIAGRVEVTTGPARGDFVARSFAHTSVFGWLTEAYAPTSVTCNSVWRRPPWYVASTRYSPCGSASGNTTYLSAYCPCDCVSALNVAATSRPDVSIVVRPRVTYAHDGTAVNSSSAPRNPSMSGKRQTVHGSVVA